MRVFRSSGIAVFDPRLWIPMARALRASNGSHPPTAILCATGTAVCGGALLQAHFYVVVCLYAWMACNAIVASIASMMSLMDSLCSIGRLRFRGYRRPRFRCEVARASCIVGMMSAMGIFCFLVAGRELSAPAGWLFWSAAGCLALFVTAGKSGYVYGLITGQSMAGRAYECTDAFYAVCLGGTGVLSFALYIAM